MIFLMVAMKCCLKYLHFDFYSIPPIEIAKLTVEVNSKRYGGEPTSIRKLLFDKANKPAKDLFDTGINPSLKKCKRIIEQLIADVSNITLATTICKYYSACRCVALHYAKQ